MLDATVGKERRQSYRYETVHSLAYLGWWEEPGFHSVAGELKNLSNGGALMLSPVPPPEGEPLWIGQTGMTGDGWTGVSLVSVTPTRPARFEVRLRFVESCPYELFSMAVHGIAAGY
jgi:hypothetical protein